MSAEYINLKKDIICADIDMDNRNDKMFEMFITDYNRDSHDLLLSETPCNTYDVQKNQPMCDKNKYPFKTNVLNTNKHVKDVELEHDLQISCKKKDGKCPSQIRGAEIPDPVLPKKWRLGGNVNTNYCPYNLLDQQKIEPIEQCRPNVLVLNIQSKNKYDRRYY